MDRPYNIPFFAVEIHSGGFIPHRLLFHDHVEEMLEHANFHGSHIYYLVRVPKIRFNSAACELTNRSLTVDLNVMPAHRVTEEIDLSALSPFSHSPPEAIAALDFQIDRSCNNEDYLRIVSHRADIQFDLPVINVVAARDIDVGFRPEIIYVGQSYDMVERWQNHKQVNRALSILSDDEELRLYCQ
jgi:hypothetical protein